MNAQNDQSEYNIYIENLLALNDQLYPNFKRIDVYWCQENKAQHSLGTAAAAGAARLAAPLAHVQAVDPGAL